MARKKKHEEHENLERWLVSYADFITLLFAFFVVMYSISSVNEGKYRVLSDSLIAAFRNPPKSIQPIDMGSPSKSPVLAHSKPGKTPSLVHVPNSPATNPRVMQRIATQIEHALKPLIDKRLIHVHRDKLWVEVEINNKILFPSGSAELEPEAAPALNKLATVLDQFPNHIDVEGFTDDLPINTRVYPSNWELSAARAASVVHLFMNAGVAPKRMAAIGYGQYRPLASNDTEAGRAQNRRVVVVILAKQGKDARRLLEIERQGQSAHAKPGAAPANGAAGDKGPDKDAGASAAQVPAAPASAQQGVSS